MANGSAGVGTALILFTSGAWLVGLCVGVPRHLVDESWPPHARFHAIQALLWVVALNVTIALLTLGPVRRGERWALFLLALLLICGQGSYFIAFAFIPGGAPPAYAHIGSAISAALYTVGLILVAAAQRSR